MSNENIKILILDDDPDDVFLVMDTLNSIEDSSYDICAVYKIDDAFSELEENAFDVVLCDYQLGAQTGIDFMRRLRAEKQSLPVILLTGMSDSAIDEAALGAGASEYICKADLTAPTLERSIRYVVANASRQRFLSDVLEGIDVAICVTTTGASAHIWNETFLSYARMITPQGDDGHVVSKLLTQIMGSKDKTIQIDELSMDVKITVLDKGKTVVAMHDVSDHMQALRKTEEAESKAALQAKLCPLTNLPNRLGLVEKLDEVIRSGKPFHLLNLDLNKFKDVNDVHGHEIGDSLLNLVGIRLAECCSDDDFLARMGGDEFVAISMIEDDDLDGMALAHSFQATTQKEFRIKGKLLTVAMSIGISTFPTSGSTAQQLLSNADVAMYRAKHNPASNIQYFDSELDTAVRERKVLTNDLANSVRNGDIKIALQPIYCVKREVIVCFEALARWEHPQFGMISPDLFISIAEENGLIEELGESVLRRACESAVQWPSPINVAVNVSGLQVRFSDLVSTVHQVLVDTGLPAKRLEIEVTESVLMDDLEHAIHVLRGLKNLGVSLAMDDFGTGFSSLSSLISFPFDKLKIDRSFIDGLENSEKRASVAKTCIGLGRNMNMIVVAEGIETEEQVDFLKQYECLQMQGYLLGKPMSQENAKRHLLEFNGNHWSQSMLKAASA